MKLKSVDSIILAVVALLACLAASTEPAAAAPQAKTAKAAPAPKTPDPAEWDTLVKNARKEGRVAIYGSVIGNTAGQLQRAFRDRYGINLEFFQGRGAEIIEKLLTERRAGLYVADIGIGGLTTYVGVIAPANIVVPLEPLIVTDEVKDGTKWRAGRIPFLDKKKQVVALAALASLYITVNGTMVKESEITSFNDLLDPKWKGKIVINDPTSSGRGNSWFTYMLLKLHGREKGKEYMKKLVLNQPVVMRDERLQTEWVARGKYPVLIGAKPTVIETFVTAGAPLKWVKVREQAPLSSGSLNLNALQNAPHPNAQKLFVNWILGREAGEIIAKTSGYPSERTDVARTGFDPSLLPGPNDVLEDEDYLLQKSELQKIASEIFKDILQ